MISCPFMGPIAENESIDPLGRSAAVNRSESPPASRSESESRSALPTLSHRPPRALDRSRSAAAVRRALDVGLFVGTACCTLRHSDSPPRHLMKRASPSSASDRVVFQRTCIRRADRPRVSHGELDRIAFFRVHRTASFGAVVPRALDVTRFLAIQSARSIRSPMTGT